MSEALAGWWVQIQSEQVRQGDLLTACFVPLFHPDFGEASDVTESVEVREYDCIVLTQSCDLENQKAPLVAVCPVATLTAYEQVDPRLAQKGEWERVRQGRVEGLHLLASPSEPSDNRACLVVDFRQIYSLPVGYLQVLALQLGPRWRLQSPFLEHFSQAFRSLLHAGWFAGSDPAVQKIVSFHGILDRAHGKIANISPMAAASASAPDRLRSGRYNSSGMGSPGRA